MCYNIRMLSNRTKGIVAITVSAFGFSLMAAAVRLANDFGGEVSSFEKSFFRNLVALAVAAAVFARRRFVREAEALALPAGPRVWATLVLRAALGTAGIFANFYALGRIPIAEGQTLNKAAPFFTVIFAWLFLGERFDRRQFGALILASLGVLLIAKPGFAGANAWPLAIGLLSGACAGGAYAAVRSLRRHGVDAAFIVLFFSVFSCLASIPFMIAHFDPLTLGQLLVLFGAGAGAAIGQFGITAAYGYAAPREIAVYDYSSILFTAVFGYLLFGQLPDLWSFAGFAVIILAALSLNGKDKKV